jgi:L-alanine-DL-glutamate epimerase-like enolase superfamily enzyme
MSRAPQTLSPPIERLDVTAYRLPLDEPESDGTLTWDHTDVVVVEPVAGGERGLGYTYAPAAAAALVQEVLEPVVTGRPVEGPPSSWRAMVRAVRNLGRPGLVSYAIAAVDIALWDLAAKIAGEPLCRMLGMVRDAVPVYGSGGFTSLDDDALCAQLRGWAVDAQIPRVKMKIATDWGTDERRDLGRIARARDAIGDTTELYVDANGGYTRKQAIRLAASMRDFDVRWFEEPVSSDDLDGLHEVRSQSAIEITAGEYGCDLAYFARMCAAGAVDCLQADVSRCAGITEWVRAATVAAAHGLDVSGHCAPSLHAHPACAVQNLRHVEYFADHVRADRILFDGVLQPVQGALRPDLSRPGMGLELRRADAERYLVS